MRKIWFTALSLVDLDDLLKVANEGSLRRHLVDHEDFTAETIREWIEEKLAIDALEGCRIRAVYIDDSLAGWCGVQPDTNGFELAIVVSQRFWGCGISIFKTLMRWAKELGHKEVVCHLLDSRAEYKVLKKMASKVDKTELLGRCFTTYYLQVR